MIDHFLSLRTRNGVYRVYTFEEVFNFGVLPRELQERILVDVAATRLLTGGPLKEVYDTLATVCQDWREMILSRWFREKFTRLAFVRG